MEKEPIIAPQDAHYLDRFMTELPVNCLFDKGRTNTGGTTLAIKNEKDTIIAMPYVSLIKNKAVQHPDRLLGVHGEISKQEIIDYIHTRKNEPMKFAVTYDSIERLIGVLAENGIDTFSRFFLLIDEWHILFNSYVFRNRAIKRLLSISRKFDEVTYMTATPVEDEFILEEIKDLPIKQVVWSNTIPVKIKTMQTNSPTHTACALIKDALDGKMFGNLHFFVNSVEFIAEVIRKAKLTPEQVKVVCSKNTNLGRGKKTNQAKLGNDYLIQEAIDPCRKINFYTSTCFEGCDIFDEDGRIYIVSDKNISHTLLDISTLATQICGRIRNSRYSSEVHHIFSETRYEENVTLEEFTAITRKAEDTTIRWVDSINAMDEDIRLISIAQFEQSKEGAKEIKYTARADNRLVFDKNLIKVDILNFKIMHHLYNSYIAVQDEYRKKGFEVRAAKSKIFTDELVKNKRAKISFKDLFIEYAELKKEEDHFIFTFGNIDDRKSLIEQERPLIKEAYAVLGAARVEELNYIQTNIKRELEKVSDASKRSKIVNLIDDEFPKLTPLSVPDITKMLQAIYDALGIKSKAKASHLSEWYDTKKIGKKIDGKTVDHYIIIRNKTL